MSGRTVPEVEHSGVLCACTEPHWWGGVCAGQAVTATQGITAMLARVNAMQSDPATQHEQIDGVERVFRTYAIGGAELGVLIAALQAALIAASTDSPREGAGRAAPPSATPREGPSSGP